MVCFYGSSELTWRDVQHIIVQTSNTERLQNEADADWRQNAAGHVFSDYFGFGLLDAEAMINLANPETWMSVPEKSICTYIASSEFDARWLCNIFYLKYVLWINRHKMIVILLYWYLKI